MSRFTAWLSIMFYFSKLFFDCRTTGRLCFRRSHRCCKIMFNLGANYECLYRCQKCCVLLLQTCHSVFGRFRFVSTWRYQNSNQAVFDRYFKKSTIFGVQSIPLAWDWFLWGMYMNQNLHLFLTKETFTRRVIYCSLRDKVEIV